MKKTRNLPKQTKQSGEVRIIAGLWRGRKLSVLNAEGLRPTSDRVKEMLFNWLMHDVAGCYCLDCFAGSGSLGIEALSRQAKAVVFLEKFANAASVLRNNVAHLTGANASVINTDTLQYLAQKNTQQPFELVFIDPPFHNNLVPEIIALLERNDWLVSKALIYVETEKDHLALQLPANWQLLKEKVTGQVISRLFQRL
ncbi:16S rRNA (guanine(966)-N(2))-methyltransferase RsmD [[Haemophilus] ducreyi]|uniref:16S rRNA (guanine(966)-N(2))-methyltransferase RsmD n=1 Tax=Haemophilus ducreyi TaxID=730 RepID=UPI0006559606|nr:16S rRNA (guanine(966)-N(2))-methyltransferase RsmD [[Haemophilus] ducreyi]AKO45326.1 16S rRNA methyltransferase [[Haemophilus] ducreyi]AKO46711.1 16S rRNA methyltransferase [[Haemophilus] ducreyi]AKO48052.1 16S rRNA methyltransferase [[Haemophilus] ducreyi]AKO49439.1 16S rRNA methyltransferase [[Haemophilus] ducreyi]ANF67773.1 16S rRNA (guanine(966)-N(2))-methyltransferase RsmD [[Haemophilus] ducreyi]